MASDAKGTWQRVTRRLRVPLGFVTAGVFLVTARPRGRALAAGLPAILGGLALRAYAAGYVRKNAELTRTGPYAYTRNPLYLGSMLIAFGFAVAAGRVRLGALLAVLFLAVYWPTILAEEAYLREVFPEFAAYAAAVPRLLPRRLPARQEEGREEARQQGAARRFSPERYRHHREYNALMGAAALYSALGWRAWTARRGR